MMLRIVLIDDEYLAIKVLENYISEIPSLVLAGSFTDPQKGLDFINAGHADLLLLDIQMPGLSGLDLVERLERDVMIVFTTARSDFAVKAFELNVLDYLVKPVSPERFKKVIEKAVEMSDFLKAKRSNKTLDFIMIRADHRMHKVPLNDIIAIEGLSEYVRVYTKTGTLITLATLNSFAETLAPGTFVRIHKSYIIAMPAVMSVTANSVSLTNNRTLPIGRTFKTSFRDAALKFGFDL